MATHSSVLAWRIPGTGEPGGLPSMGSHRVRHDWSDLAAAAQYYTAHLLLVWEISCPPLMGTPMSLGSKWWQSWIRKRLKPGEFWKHHLKELYEERRILRTKSLRFLSELSHSVCPPFSLPRDLHFQRGSDLLILVLEAKRSWLMQEHSEY